MRFQLSAFPISALPFVSVSAFQRFSFAPLRSSLHAPSCLRSVVRGPVVSSLMSVFPARPLISAFFVSPLAETAHHVLHAGIWLLDLKSEKLFTASYWNSEHVSVLIRRNEIGNRLPERVVEG